MIFTGNKLPRNKIYAMKWDEMTIFFETISTFYHELCWCSSLALSVFHQATVGSLVFRLDIPNGKRHLSTILCKSHSVCIYELRSIMIPHNLREVWIIKLAGKLSCVICFHIKISQSAFQNYARLVKRGKSLTDTSLGCHLFSVRIRGLNTLWWIFPL